MDPLILGLVVFVTVTSALSFAIVVALRRGRAEGLTGAPLLRRTLPLLIADGLFTLVWVVWLVGNL